MRGAVSYARVSSKEQEQGYSLDSQVRTLREYSASKAFRIAKEFTYSESAKEQGRKHFNSMLEYLRQHPEIRIVLVEKTDRPCRNLKDFVLVENLVEELGLEIHLVKEGQVLRTDSKSQDRLVQGMFALLARNYIQNLQEEILKGQIIKAEKGQYPGRAPFGYVHDRQNRTIVAHPTRAAVVTLLFQRYSTCMYTAQTLRKLIIEKTGERISKSRLHAMLKYRFYLGVFTWRGREYQGAHPPLVDSVTFNRVQEIISGRNVNKCKPNAHAFPFSGLLNCADDNCAITAEVHKKRYVYYRCSFGRGRHKFPYIPEPKLSDMLGSVLKPIAIPANIAHDLVRSVSGDQASTEKKRQQEVNRFTQQLSALQVRMRSAYRDKLDGIIAENFWRRNMEDWSAKENQLNEALQRTSALISKDRTVAAQKILELAQIAHSAYFTLNPHEQGKLVKMVLSNCRTDGVSLFPSYRKPFDLIAERAKNEEWRRERDSNPR
jgi:site-specific DNA recombinase